MKTTLSYIITFLLIQMFYPASSQTYRILVIPEKSRDYVFIDLTGKTIFQPEGKYFQNFIPEGTALAHKDGGRGIKLYDVNGDEIFPETEFKIWGEDYLIEVIPIYYKGGIIRTKQTGLWGGIDAYGKVAVPFIYDELTDFDEGYALAKRDGTFFVVDDQGGETIVEGQQITYIKHFSEGLAPIEVKGEIFGFINTSGTMVIQPAFKGVGYFSGGMAWARNDKDDIGFINKEGQWIIQPQFKMVNNFDPESGLAKVYNRPSQLKCNYVDTHGEIKDFDKTSVTFDFTEGLAIGKSGEKYGFLNNQGEWAIMPIFEDATGFINGYARVKVGGSWGVIDKEGNTILPPVYRSIGEVVIIENSSSTPNLNDNINTSNPITERNSPESTDEQNVVIDERDGTIYSWIAIGKQTWLVENMNYGTMIPGNRKQEDNSVAEKYCYNDDEQNCKKFGGLYQWDEAMAYKNDRAQGICPDGWHVPSTEEWLTLIEFLGGKEVAGGKMKAVGLKYWKEAATSTNSSGFSAVGAGFRSAKDKKFDLKGVAAYLRSSSSGEYFNLFSDKELIRKSAADANAGFSVRCIKD